jgi:hypothetical protein
MSEKNYLTLLSLEVGIWDTYFFEPSVSVRQTYWSRSFHNQAKIGRKTWFLLFVTCDFLLLKNDKNVPSNIHLVLFWRSLAQRARIRIRKSVVRIRANMSCHGSGTLLTAYNSNAYSPLGPFLPFCILNPDPDSLNHLNPDPTRSRILKHRIVGFCSGFGSVKPTKGNCCIEGFFRFSVNFKSYVKIKFRPLIFAVGKL